jgi:hypothetical protein
MLGLTPHRPAFPMMGKWACSFYWREAMSDQKPLERSWLTVACDKRVWYTLKAFCHSQGLPAQKVLERLITKFLDDHQVRLLDKREFDTRSGPPGRNELSKTFRDWVAKDLVGMVK